MSANMPPEHEKVFRGLTASDRETIESVLTIQLENVEKSGLDPKTYSLVRLAALIAMDASPASFAWNIAIAMKAGVTTDEIMGVLVALAPTVGLARIVSTAPEIAYALGIEIEPEERAA